MTEESKKTIHIPEIVRVEGHAAVDVCIQDGRVTDVKLDVFEGTRFFEQIVVGHKFDEIPHLTSRVCAICSTGHVIAAARAIEKIFEFEPSETTELYRELMHLGMIIESHATHIFALALPDFLGVRDLATFAGQHAEFFNDWTQLRNLGAAIQTLVGGRPFHPVSLHVGGLSHYPSVEQMRPLLDALSTAQPAAEKICAFLLEVRPKVSRTTQPAFLALIPEQEGYGFFGNKILSSQGWEADIQTYREYLNEYVVPYSHAKQSTARGEPLMVGSMARLSLFGERITGTARDIWTASPLYQGETNTVLNNLAQAIEIVYAIQRASELISLLTGPAAQAKPEKISPAVKGGGACGAVECPRGTLYHYYELDEAGTIARADMITPSAQNTKRIELDIKEVVEKCDPAAPDLEAQLETLVRAYDPCNTCATHMVSVSYTTVD
jgi:sulfhydrogenase subunit alpha